MHEPPPPGIAHTLQLGVAMEQTRGQGWPAVPGTGMHHQTGWLVDDDQVGVFVDDAELDHLGHEGGRP